MVKWIIVLLSIALMLNSCNKCKLENSYTINIIRDSTWVHITGEGWMTYTPEDIRETVFSNMRASFKDPNQIDVVAGPADFMMIIDSVSTGYSSWTETVEDPCYGDHSWLYQQLHPPEEYTYTLHGSIIRVYARLTDTLRQQTTPYNFVVNREESLYRPEPTDSTDCQGYQVQGDAYPRSELEEVGTGCYNSVRCQIYHDIEGHQ